MLALIMAGGSGTRFWPRSRTSKPKQLLNIHGESTMIQQTVNRLLPIIPPEGIYVVSTLPQIEEIKQQLPQIHHSNILVEPIGKNTAPCIGLGALFMQHNANDEVMVVLPADHLIQDEDEFRKKLLCAETIAKKDGALITLGIKPTKPATGYGYIQHTTEDIGVEDILAYKVKTFAEKPNYATACRFLESGDFLWNSGIFVWKISSILHEMKELMPEMWDGLEEIRKALGTPEQDEVIERVYRQIRNISIDYGIMEQAGDVVVLPSSFGWNDVGSWDEVYRLSQKDDDGNSADAKHILLDSSNCLIDVQDKIVAAIGLENFVVVDTGDALLICPRDKAQQVKEVVDLLKERDESSLL